MADLTRFDFNAKNFLTSETVRRMSDAEVGQYVLLLAEAWLCGRDTTLPDDMPFLARLAHTDKISDRVLEKFPLVETNHGLRRRNEVLYGEWVEAQRRSEAGREKAEKRWGVDKPASRVNANFIPVHADSNAAGDAQAVPSRTNPNQSNQPNNTTGGAVGVEGDQSKIITTVFGCDWSNIRSRHRHTFGKKPDKTFYFNKYVSACKEYGEEVVLACFDEWAPTAMEWVRRDNVSHPLSAFFKKLPDMAEEEKAVQSEKQQEATVLAAEEAARLRDAAATDIFVRQQQNAHAKFMEYEPPKPSEMEPEIEG